MLAWLYERVVVVDISVLLAQELLACGALAHLLRIVVGQFVAKLHLHFVPQQLELRWVDKGMDLTTLRHERLRPDLLGWQVFRHAGLAVRHVDFEDGVANSCVPSRFNTFWLHHEALLDVLRALLEQFMLRRPRPVLVPLERGNGALSVINVL